MSIFQFPTAAHGARGGWRAHARALPALLASALGLTVIGGWHAKLPALIQLHPDLVPMQYNTALALALAGAALLAHTRGARLIARLAAGFVALIGSATLLQFLTGAEFGIDRLLMEPYITVKSPHPGRMAPTTAFCFMLMGGGILLATCSDRLRYCAATAGLLGVTVIAVAAAALLGYAIDLEVLASWKGGTYMAVHTAFGQLLLGTALVAASAQRIGPGQADRYTFTAALSFSAILVLTLLLWSALDRYQHEHARAAAEADTLWFGQRINDAYRLRIDAIERMARRWEFSRGTARETWESDAQAYVRDMPGLQAVQWIDNDLRVRWIIPVAGNERVLGLDNSADPSRARIFEQARQARRGTAGAALNLMQGGQGMLYVRPLFVEEPIDGFLVAVFRVDALAASVAGPDLTTGAGFRLEHQDTQTQGRSPTGHSDEGSISHPLTLGDGGWTLTVTWGSNAHHPEDSMLPRLVLAAGIILAAFAGVVNWLWGLTARRARDIAQAHATLAETTQQLTEAQALAHVGSWHLDVATNQVVWSEQLYKMLGFDPRLPPPPYTEHQKLFTAESWAQLSTALARTVETGDPYQLELEMVRNDGSRGWMWARGERVCDAHGAPISLRGVAQDITDRKHAERELREARDAALAAARIKSEFVATMSHEIRTPMNGVLGIAQVLANTQLDATQRNYVAIILRSGNALLTVLNDILDFSKIEAGRLELEHSAFNLPETLAEVVELFREQARGKQLNLALHYPADCPRRVMGDSGRVRQIVLNLVGNAVKFTDKGGVSVEVTALKPGQGQARVRIAVNDTGIGISPDARARLFNSFSQVDTSSTRKYGGTGLGLAICKRLVELMGGEIGVSSTPGQGSTFWFTVPLQIGADDAPESELQQAATTGRPMARPSAPARVLLVDDVDINQMVITAMLEPLGLTVDIANNGAEALQRHSQGGYDLVLMDCLMPLMDGHEATRRIRASEARGKHIPIIALTAGVMKPEQDQCFAAGMDDFLPKPVDARALQDKVMHWLAANDAGNGNGEPPLSGN